MAGILLNTNQQEKELQKPVNGLDAVFGFLNKDIKLFGNQLKDKKKQPNWLLFFWWGVS